VEAGRLEAAAESLRRLEDEGRPVDLLKALRGPAISRNRVIELLLQ
jgi:hypothetical protein